MVTRQQIEDQGLRDTGAILASAPGISVTRSDSNRYSFSARGFSIDNFQFDGLSTPILSLWNYGTTDIDAAIYDRVEVVRGATGLMNGSGNPSAAVNFCAQASAARLRRLGQRRRRQLGQDPWRGRPVSAPDRERQDPLARGGRLQPGQQQRDLPGCAQPHVLWRGQRRPDARHRADRQRGIPAQHQPRFRQRLSLFYSDGSRTDFNRSVANNTPWARQDTESTTYFVDLTHRFANDWKLRAAYSHSDGKYRMKQLFRGGYPDRATGLGMTSNFANYDGRRDRDDIHLSLNALFTLVRPAPRDRRRLDEH